MLQDPFARSLTGLLLERTFEGGKASTGKPGVVLEAERGQQILRNDILEIRVRLVEDLAEEHLQLGGNWRVEQQEQQLLQLDREETLQKAALVVEATHDRLPKMVQGRRHFEDHHFIVRGRRRTGIHIRTRYNGIEPEAPQSGFVEENRNALVFGVLGHTRAKKVASAFEENGFARLHDDLLFGKTKDLRSLGNEYKCVLRHEYVARLLFDALMVFAEAKPARLKEAAIGRA